MAKPAGSLERKQEATLERMVQIVKLITSSCSDDPSIEISSLLSATALVMAATYGRRFSRQQYTAATAAGFAAMKEQFDAFAEEPECPAADGFFGDGRPRRKGRKR